MLTPSQIAEMAEKKYPTFKQSNIAFAARNAYIAAFTDAIELMSKEWVPISEVDTLQLGIEIVAAMKASLCNWDIEQGRLMALEDTYELTESDIIGSNDISIENLPFHNEKVVPFERERLYKQALFAANSVIDFLTKPPVLTNDKKI